MNLALKNLIKKHIIEDTSKEQKKQTVLIIDFMNLFYRSYLAVKVFDYNDYHCGGIVGTLNSLKSVVKQFVPDKIYICNEGKDSAKQRQKINEHYKAGRKGSRQSPFKENEYIKELPEESFQRQLAEVTQLIRYLPVYNLEEEGLEADDLISFLCKFHSNEYKIISSVDRDFYQLINDNTICYNPLSKKYINTTYLLSAYKIHPLNFSQSRAFFGDSSDNLDGIRGIKEKTFVKLFPFVNEEKEFSLDYFFQYADEHKSLSEKYKTILNNKKLIEDNYEIMELRTNRKSHNVTNLINYIQSTKPNFEFNTFLNTLVKRYPIKKEMMYDWNFAFSRI